MTEAELFHRCRKALGLSRSALARELVIVSDRTIRRWEDGKIEVAGPAWVALSYMLARIPGAEALTHPVAAVIERRRAANARRSLEDEP